MFGAIGGHGASRLCPPYALQIAVGNVHAGNDLVSLRNLVLRIAPINRLPTAVLLIAPQKI
jgi:hypothetical protein